MYNGVMNHITVSAPGKLLLFGEHAAVYRHPCIVTAVGMRMNLTLEKTSGKDFILDAPDVGVSGYTKHLSSLGTGDIPKGVRFIEQALKNFLEIYPQTGGFHVTTASEFSCDVGFGSSSASTVCMVKALSEIFDVHLDNANIFQIAYKTILDIQKRGSGFDVAAAIWGGTINFVTGGVVIDSISVPVIPLVIGYTGVKADTADIVGDVASKREKFPEKVNRIFDAVEKITVEARQKIVEGDWERVGILMNYNQEYLRDLGVSTEKLESMISAAKKSGAWGAKLSGAGGGDCMIALVSDDKRKIVGEAITGEGGQVIEVAVNAPGVRVEA